MTDKSHLLTAWNNVPDAYRQSSLMLAIGEALAAMPQPHTNHRDAQVRLDALAKRIGTGDRGKLGENGRIFQWPAVLGYQGNWQGEWEVSNRDLEGLGYFRMWIERAETPHFVFSYVAKIFSAVKGKRMWQAWLRYEKTGLTSDHCRVLAKMLWEVDVWRCDGVSLYVQGKRPMGNSYIPGDIFEATGWEVTWDPDDGMPETEEERAWNLMDELAFAAPDAAKQALNLNLKSPTAEP